MDATHLLFAFRLQSLRKKNIGELTVFDSKKFRYFFAVTFILGLTTAPFITTAHQSNVCPVHSHTTSSSIGTCSNLWDGESTYDVITGCWTYKRCRLYVHTEEVVCPDGVQDNCSACGEGTDECNAHLADHLWGCEGNNKSHSWYTCQTSGCPYEPSSS